MGNGSLVPALQSSMCAFTEAVHVQVVERTDAGELTAAQGMDIEFRDVTFGYRDDQDILQVRLSALGE